MQNYQLINKSTNQSISEQRVNMNNMEILNDICKIQESIAKDYFESKERFFLINVSKKIQANSSIYLNDDEVLFLKKIFKKYMKFPYRLDQKIFV